MSAPIGEVHIRAPSPSAALRSADRRPELRVTLWYPAAEGTLETRRVVGPSAAPFFEGGTAGDDAVPAPGPATWPVVLLSHGFGGSARMMSWFGTELARHGTLVVAVDHPGSNGIDSMTVPGALLWWDRADDLRAAWDAVRADPRFSRRADPSRLGVAGFSAGGFTALVAAGARVDLAHFDRFCADHPDDGVCRPQVEMPGLAARDRASAFEDPAMREAESRASGDHAITGVRAAFLMAPALVQALDPDSLRTLAVPTEIVLGADDHVAPPATNGQVAARLVPRARLVALDRVGHYDFLSTCTEAGRAAVPLCHSERSQDETHREAISHAVAFFSTALKPVAKDAD